MRSRGAPSSSPRFGKRAPSARAISRNASRSWLHNSTLSSPPRRGSSAMGSGGSRGRIGTTLAAAGGAAGRNTTISALRSAGGVGRRRRRGRSEVLRRVRAAVRRCGRLRRGRGVGGRRAWLARRRLIGEQPESAPAGEAAVAIEFRSARHQRDASAVPFAPAHRQRGEGAARRERVGELAVAIEAGAGAERRERFAGLRRVSPNAAASAGSIALKRSSPSRRQRKRRGGGARCGSGRARGAAARISSGVGGAARTSRSPTLPHNSASASGRRASQKRSDLTRAGPAAAPRRDRQAPRAGARPGKGCASSAARSAAANSATAAGLANRIRGGRLAATIVAAPWASARQTASPPAARRSPRR